MDEPERLEIHLLNFCKCRECTRIRREEANAQLREQRYWHPKPEEICCGDCPQCWHHY